MCDAVITAEGLHQRPPGDVLLDGVWFHRRLHGRGGRRKSGPRRGARPRPQDAPDRRLLFGRRAHDGGHSQPDANGEGLRRAGAPRRCAPAVYLRAHRSHHRRRHGQLRHARRSEYRRTRRADRFRRPARDRADHSPDACPRAFSAPNFCCSTDSSTPWCTAKTSRVTSPTRSTCSWRERCRRPHELRSSRQISALPGPRIGFAAAGQRHQV